MDLGKWIKAIPKWFQKYRYPIVILLAGLVLFILPSRQDTLTQTTTPANTTPKTDLAQNLTQILTQIEGVGKVKVMLTVAEGERTLYQSDEDVTTGETTSSVRKDTVILTDTNRAQQALVLQVLPPKYLGAVIVCQGADIPAVKWSVVEAVSKATGLGADRISVLKMK